MHFLPTQVQAILLGRLILRITIIIALLPNFADKCHQEIKFSLLAQKPSWILSKDFRMWFPQIIVLHFHLVVHWKKPQILWSGKSWNYEVMAWKIIDSYTVIFKTWLKYPKTDGFQIFHCVSKINFLILEAVWSSFACLLVDWIMSNNAVFL